MTAGNGMEIHAHTPRTPERSEALWHQGLAGPTLGPVLSEFKELLLPLAPHNVGGCLGLWSGQVHDVRQFHALGAWELVGLIGIIEGVGASLSSRPDEFVGRPRK